MTFNYSADIVGSNAGTQFMLDEKFIKAYEACKSADRGRLLLADSSYDIRWRIHTLIWAAKYASKIEGDFVDCGAGFGLFSSAIFEYLDFGKIDKNYYLIDSYEGLSKEHSSDFELKRTGDYYSKNNPWYDEIVERFASYENAKIIKGYIPEILTEVPADKIVFMSIDMNTTIPEQESLKYFWPKIVSGGIIIFDDYGFIGHESQKEAHDKFAKEQNLLIYSSPTGQGILIKP
jgi:hypothetical protein